LTRGHRTTKIQRVGPSLDRHRRLRAVFDEALSMDPSSRDAYLTHACAGDAVLRADVVRLLARHREARSFLEQPLDLLAPARDQQPFTGTDRFRVVRRLGAGGMGVVYEVHDALRHEAVALKTLRRGGAADLFRLKQEFRVLADVTHPNLVCLYELFVDDEQCFFTMELVDGVNFVDYARGTDGGERLTDRLVDALQQLIDGVSAVHGRGKLHRDIKPSNVLVTRDGRVVVLDFGLATELAALRSDARPFRGGTPAYMSPEEAAGATPTEASDWYAVGATLYEALTTTVPFEGAAPDVLLRKATSDPPPPSVVSTEVPADLSAVCMGLLHRDPAQRLTGSAVLRALARDTHDPTQPSITIQDAPFVGRLRELRELADASQAVVAGRARIVAVHGASGIGKSALIRHFLSQFAASDDVVVLRGRCYENESVPYKALDGVVDDLSRYLQSCLPSEVDTLLPRDLSALTRVFPVLLQVSSAATSALQQERQPVDPLRVRRQAFDALSAVLRRLAARRLLVIWIDDLQWADADSVVLLEELLGPADPPSMLVLLCFREEEVAIKPFLQTILDRVGRDGWSDASLEALNDAEASTLVREVLRSVTLSDDDCRRMTREAGGSPFVLEQLASHAAMAGSVSHHAPTFAEVFDAKLRALTPDARHFLEALAICGRPMAPEIISDACGIDRDRQSLVVRLRSAHLIRSSGSSERIEAYHARIREVLVQHVEADAARLIHGRLAASLVARQSDDCEALFEHYRGAGDWDLASVQAGLAAEKADSALAFDRAASFYSHALELAPGSATAQKWQQAVATALANAGRPAEAAEAYLGAAQEAEPNRRVELQRRAAEQFLTGGHIDRGLDLLRRVLGEVGLSYARSPRIAAVRVLGRRVRLRWRGTGFATRRVEDVDPGTLHRLDTCWAAATGMAMVEPIVASDFFAQHLQLALDAGEPSRIARGMALESSLRSSDWLFRKGAVRLFEQSEQLARRVGTLQAMATAALADSVCACGVGQWERARASGEHAVAMFRDGCVGVAWELTMAQNIVLWALLYLGELCEVSRRVPALLDDARRRGNLYLVTELCTRCNFVWLIADQPDEGERDTIDAIARWSQRGFDRQHYGAMIALVQTALYRGDGTAAWRLLAERESGLGESMLTYIQPFRIETLFLRARSAVAAAVADPSATHFLPVARNCARRIARENVAWATPIAGLLRSGIASIEGNRTTALTLLQEAAAQFDGVDMKLYAAVARRRLAELRDDDEGRDLGRQADAWMASQQIKNPAAFTRMLAPGFPGRMP
jgi:tetratricopeptide (TPR) repeat protein